MLLRLPRTKNIYYLISFTIGSILYYSFFNNDYLGQNDFKTNIKNFFFDDIIKTNNTIELEVKPLINLTTTTVTSTTSASSTTLTNSNSSTTITSTSTTLLTSINSFSTSVASTTLAHLNTSTITTITSTSTTLISSINSFSTSVESATLATSPQLNINESCPLIPPNLGNFNK